MDTCFTISQAARMTRLTAETLRHYDRIGLAPPSQKDPQTGYRLYSREDVVRLHTIRVLRCMGLALPEIRRALALDSLSETIAFLRRAEEDAEERITRLREAQRYIRRARTAYEEKQAGFVETPEFFQKRLDRRIILLSCQSESPSLSSLWNYQHRFFQQLPPEKRASFRFADTAGIYIHQGQSRLFALCLEAVPVEGLMTLPSGNYLCACCPEERREETRARLTETVRTAAGREPAFGVQLIRVNGILKWDYEIQVFCGEEKVSEDAILP